MNLNDDVRVRITEFGMECLRKNHDEDRAYWEILGHPGLPFNPPKTDSEGYSTWALWELMAEFGKYCSPGLPPVIENNEIRMEDRS